MTQEELRFAGFWVRFFAGCLDLAFLLPVMFLLIYLAGGDVSDVENSFGISGAKANIISVVVSVPYVVYFLSHKSQATIGKRLLGIYVGRPDGSKLVWYKSLIRSLSSMITAATFGLGFLTVLVTKEKISLHDFLCCTRVFHGRKS